MINYVVVDDQQILKSLIVKVQQALDEVLYPGDERRVFLEQEAQVIVALYNAIDDSARQNLLRYARGEVLDAIGEEKDTPRLTAQFAKTTIQFSLSQAQSTDTVITKGTRVTPDGVIFFVTDNTAVISAGSQLGTVTATCTVAGTAGNGFVAGQIDKLVDPFAFASTVTNTITSYDGADQEEDDNGEEVWSEYRGRIRLASAKKSTAGHELGYIYYAKSADNGIGDVIVTSPSAGAVKITVLMSDGTLPSSTILTKVLEACSAEKVRPTTDNVATAAPTQVTYNTVLTYYLPEDIGAGETNIKTAVAAAIAEYYKWQDTKMARDINPDKLRQLILNAGAVRVDITTPVYTTVGATEVAKHGTETITYGGLL